MSTETTNKTPFNQKAELATTITGALFIALIGLFIYWNVGREGGFKLSIFAFQTLPLLVLIPGMLKNAYRGYSWLCFVLLFYFIFAVQLVFSSTRQTSDFIFLALTVCLFISSMMASRWRQRQIKGVM